MRRSTRTATPRLRGYGSLAALALTGALASGRPELVALAAPFVVYLIVGIGSARDPDLEAHAEIDRDRALEGDELQLQLTVENHGVTVDVEVTVIPGSYVQIVEPAPVLVRLSSHEPRTFVRTVRPLRWGLRGLATVQIQANDPLRLFVWRYAAIQSGQLKVYPRAEYLQRLVAPRQTQLLSGNRAARWTGDGIEFAAIREFRPGDRPRRINWHATSRRGVLHVNDRHPERNADIVLFVDAFEETRSGATGTLDMALRAAATLADHYLHERDRVGLISFGGVMTWLEPSLGVRNRYMIAEALLHAEVMFSFVWRTVGGIPPRLLPASALVVGLTPLLDPRGIAALLDLRARGYDLAIVECDPEPMLPAPASVDQEVARRLWRLQRDALRRRFFGLGVPVARWDRDQQLAIPVTEVIASRRQLQSAR